MGRTRATSANYPHQARNIYAAMKQAIAEIHRVLKPGKFMALYVSDSYEHGKGFLPHRF